VRLTEEGGSRTPRLELEHIAHDDMWEQYGPGATGIGWDSILLGPAGHLSPGGITPRGVRGLDRLRGGQAVHDPQQ